jgi:hypothetical protein
MIWNDADRMEDNSRRLSEKGEESAKKAKIPSLSVMTQLDVDVLWLGITQK